LVDSLTKDGLTDSVYQCKMGDTAEYVARVVSEVGRTEQDEFALRSHHLWAAANRQNLFEREIAPVTIDPETCKIVKDEAPRTSLTLEQLSRLSPVFNLPALVQARTGLNGHSRTVTAGNSSGLSDGAAAVVLASGSFLKKNNNGSYEGALAKVVSCQQAGNDPLVMGIAPVIAVEKALAKAGWSVEDVDLWEINEAFAATTVATIRQLKIPDWQNRVNVLGGSIAMGHPVGATGARLVVTLSYQLHAAAAAQRQRQPPSQDTRPMRGVATACIGGGQAIAICLESI